MSIRVTPKPTSPLHTSTALSICWRKRPLRSLIVAAVSKFPTCFFLCRKCFWTIFLFLNFYRLLFVQLWRLNLIVSLNYRSPSLWWWFFPMSIWPMLLSEKTARQITTNVVIFCYKYSIMCVASRTVFKLIYNFTSFAKNYNWNWFLVITSDFFYIFIS